MLAGLLVIGMGVIVAEEQIIRLSDSQAGVIRTIIKEHHIVGDNMKRGDGGHQPKRIRRAKAILTQLRGFFPEEKFEEVAFVYHGKYGVITMKDSLTINCKAHSAKNIFVTISQGSKTAPDILYSGMVHADVLRGKSVRFQ